MSNHKKINSMVAFCAAVVFIAGCIPENSLEWSEDGSVGLLRVEEGLYIVDGKTGDLTEVVKGDIGLLPDISKDGNLIAYSEKIDCNSLSKGLGLFPPGQVKMIKYYAEKTKKNILDAQGLVDEKFPFPEEGLLLPEDYRNWAIRYLCENADNELLDVLGSEGIEKGKEKAISYFQIVVAPSKNPTQKRIVAVSVFSIIATRLSPDTKSVAYLMHTQEGEVSNAMEEFGLYIASLDTDIKAMYVDSRVAFGYDWREDGQAIAYLSADSKDLLHDDIILGTLSEKVVADANGSLLTNPMDIPDHGSAGTHRCTGKTAELAGTVFYPWFKVEYGLDNRIFFSSFDLPLPASKRDEAGCSLFCYDPVTATVADVLPLSVSNHTSQQVLSISLFSLSPDGKRVLLPIEHNRFIVYTLGTDSMEIPVREEDGFGEEEIPELPPSWKGNNEFSCLVSGKSIFLSFEPQEGRDKADRREIVVLGKDGKTWKAWILSWNWPAEMKIDSPDNK
ncbi:MAG TPA: hypothetical protein VMX36_15035 [Sedimentisphaerales bacterium]|nr:hypothetical protein [Sedimentisphaerales bacterium]